MKKPKEDDLAKDLESTVDDGKFLHFDKDGNPKKAGLTERVLARFTGGSHVRDPLLPPHTDR